MPGSSWQQQVTLSVQVLLKCLPSKDQPTSPLLAGMCSPLLILAAKIGSGQDQVLAFSSGYNGKRCDYTYSCIMLCLPLGQ